MEQGLYEQVVMIHLRESNDKNEKKSDENQQDQDIGSILIMSGYKKISGHVNQIFIENCIKLNEGMMIIFGLPIGNVKITRKLQFHPAAPVIKYYQNTSNSCCLSSLLSTFHCINENRAVPALVNSIEE